MKPVYVKISLAGITSFLLLVASLLGFSSMMPKAAGSTPSSTTNPRVDLEDQPFAVGHYRSTPTNITETQVQFTFEGNTTITLPNSTETITTRDRGQGNVTFLPGEGGDGAIRGQIHMTTQDGSETTTGDFAEFMRTDESTGVGIAYFFSTNSTGGMLAPLNNKIAVFLDEVQPNEDSIIRFFEWKSGDGGALRGIDNGASTTTNGGGNDTNTAAAPATAAEIPTFTIP
jgi:hypothetical protein